MVQRAAHPRSRGEHNYAHSHGISLHGSSPLARGTHWDSLNGARRTRLIPARAGNTVEWWNKSFIPAAHPRSRGEHTTVCKTHLTGFGSSPLARGTLFAEITRRPNERLIPARAGNTSPPRSQPYRLAAHPRSRGEHMACRKCGVVGTGSSPLARGTPCPVRQN